MKREFSYFDDETALQSWAVLDVLEGEPEEKYSYISIVSNDQLISLYYREMDRLARAWLTWRGDKGAKS